MHRAAPIDQRNKLLRAVNANSCWPGQLALLDNQTGPDIAQSTETPPPCVHHIAQPSLMRNYAEEHNSWLHVTFQDAFPGASNTQTDSVRLTKQPRHYPLFIFVCCRFMGIHLVSCVVYLRESVFRLSRM